MITSQKVQVVAAEVSGWFEKLAEKSPREARGMIEAYRKYIAGIANLSKVANSIRRNANAYEAREEAEYAYDFDRYMRAMPTLPPEVKKAFDFLVLEANAQMKARANPKSTKAFNIALQNFTKLCAAEVTRAAKMVESRLGNVDVKTKAKLIGELNNMIERFDKLAEKSINADDIDSGLGYCALLGGVAGAAIGLLLNIVTKTPASLWPSATDFIWPFWAMGMAIGMMFKMR